jgi:chromosome partitioning protein
MRIDARTRAADALRIWAEGLKVPFLGVLRETQVYVKALENDLTVFDLPAQTHSADLQQWEPILEWLRPVAKLASLQKPAADIAPVPAAEPERHINMPRATSLMPAQEGLVHGNLLAYSRSSATIDPQLDDASFSRSPHQTDRFGVPQFLLRQ